MNDGPMMGGPMGMGPRGMGMGNGGPPPPESTQVTIPKDVSKFLLIFMFNFLVPLSYLS